MKVSVIIPCKNRLDHLKQSLPLVFNQTHEDLEVIVVDYNCPQKSGEWALENFECRVLNCAVGPNEWSLSAARNAGFKYSTGEVILFLDADALLTDIEFIEKHLNHCVDGSFICGWGYHFGTGCCMVRRTAFEAVKGYNEYISSYGYEDIDLYDRLQNNVANEKRVWMGGIENINHSDDIRNEYHGCEDIWKTNDNNYQIAKTMFKGL